MVLMNAVINREKFDQKIDNLGYQPANSNQVAMAETDQRITINDSHN